MTEKKMYNCPCCGNPTYSVPPKDDVGYICHVCWWENDSFIQSDDEPSDQNHGITLNQAKDNYNKCGISAPHLIIGWAESDMKLWSELIVMMCSKAETFEIHCWKEETVETALALQYGNIKNVKWAHGTVIEGQVTEKFKSFLATLPKPMDNEIYDKKTPFFSIFLDNGFSIEHYGTEINFIPFETGTENEQTGV